MPLIRLKHFLRFEKRNIVVNTIARLNFDYCSLVWDFSSSYLLNQIKSLEKRIFRSMLNDYGSNYENMLEKSGWPNLNCRRQKTLHRNLYNFVFCISSNNRRATIKRLPLTSASKCSACYYYEFILSWQHRKNFLQK